jgi:hypothetical protein
MRSRSASSKPSDSPLPPHQRLGAPRGWRSARSTTGSEGVSSSSVVALYYLDGAASRLCRRGSRGAGRRYRFRVNAPGPQPEDGARIEIRWILASGRPDRERLPTSSARSSGRYRRRRGHFTRPGGRRRQRRSPEPHAETSNDTATRPSDLCTNPPTRTSSNTSRSVGRISGWEPQGTESGFCWAYAVRWAGSTTALVAYQFPEGLLAFVPWVR